VRTNEADVTAGAPSPAVAPPPGNPRFALFDSLRGLAACAIIAFHVASITGALDDPVVGEGLTVLGPRSLILFFVISGFLLYRPFVAARAAGRPPPRTSRYLRRRVLRIVPAYWVALTVLAIFPGIVGVFTGDWWRYYFFLQLYSHDTVGHGIPVAWSLCVEVTYYLSLPLWAAAVGRLRFGSGPRAWLRVELGTLALAATGGIVIQVAAAQQVVSDLVASSLLGQVTWLALGMGLAVASVAVQHSEREPRAARAVVEHPGLCWAGAGISLVTLTVLLQPRGLLGIVQALNTSQSIPKALAAIALTASMCGLFVLPAVFGERAGGFPRRLLAAAPVAWLGLVSYGLFLWHLPIAELLALPADPAHFSASGLDLAAKIDFAKTGILFVLTLAVTAAAAAASYYTVELPFLRRKEG
jgi:peptidoglycan/LPS O-acetylase OafA/YrhL